MNMMRHIGKISNTGERCVIAFMQIPQRNDHALVIPTENLPPRFEQAVMDVVRSNEGQNEENLAVVLSRRIMPDTGKDILLSLHENGMLRAVQCAQIMMMPLPNQPIKLTEILSQLGRLNGETIQETEKFNPHLSNLTAGQTEHKQQIAKNLMFEAELLEADARKKREQAYAHDPSLRPRTVAAFNETATVEPVEAAMDTSVVTSLDELMRD